LDRNVKGNEKILVVTHSRLLEAIGADGVNPRPEFFLNSFKSMNAQVTPFLCQEEKDEKD